MTLIAASYGRTSTESNDSVSISTQHKANRRYAESIGAVVQYEFSDMFTGTVIKRPELDKLRKLINTQQIDVLVIYTPDRLARRQYVAGYLLNEEIMPNGVSLHWSSAGREIKNTPEDINLFNTETNQAEYERNKMIERTNRGKQGLLEEGVWFFAAVNYGYRKTGHRRNAKITIQEEEAEIIKWIFEEYGYNNTPVSAIADILNERRITVPGDSVSGGWSLFKKWQRKSIYNILRDEGYTGKLYHSKYETINGKKRLKAKEEWGLINRPDLAIIDSVLFNTVQKKLDNGRAMNAGTIKGEYLLARKLTCGICGKGIQVVSRGWHTYSNGRRAKLDYYKCYSKAGTYQHTHSCTLPTFRVDYVDFRAWSELERLLTDREYRIQVLESARIDQFDRNREAIEHIEAADRITARFDAELSKLTDLYLSDLITKSVFAAKKKELDTKLYEAQRIKREYEDSVTDILTDRDIARIDKDMQRLSNELDEDIPFDNKKYLIDSMGITGEIVQYDDSSHWLHLYAYSYHFTRTRLTDMDDTSGSGDSTYNDGTFRGSNTRHVMWGQSESHAHSLPGHGRSPERRPIRWCTLQYYYEFLNDEVLRQGRRPVLMGHSMGGALCHWWLKYGPPLPAVVMVGPWAHDSMEYVLPHSIPIDPLGQLMSLATLSATPAVRTPRIAFDWFLTAGAVMSPEELHARLGPESGLVLLQYAPHFGWSPAPRAHSPTLIVGAEADLAIPVRYQRAAAAHYGCDYVEVPGAGHDLMLERSYAATARAIHDWLAARVA